MLNTYQSRSPLLLARVHSKCTNDSWEKNFYKNLLLNKNIIALVAGRLPRGIIVLRYIGKEAEILNVAVIKHFQNQGVGKLLILQAFKLLTQLKVKVLILEVSINNLLAIKLYKSCGFKNIGLRKAYYLRGNGSKEDAYIMEKKL